MSDGGLYSVLYSSTATEPFDDERLAALLAQSRRDNARDGITGMLLYRDGRFFQVLEGEASAVRSLVQRIEHDGRHHDIRFLLSGDIDRREFGEWSMGYEPIDRPEGRAPDGFRDTFDDIENLDDSKAMLRALRELTVWFRVRAGVPTAA